MQFFFWNLDDGNVIITHRVPWFNSGKNFNYGTDAGIFIFYQIYSLTNNYNSVVLAI